LAAAVVIGVLLGTLFATDRALHVRERVQARIDVAAATSRQTGSTCESVQVVAQDGIRLDGWAFVPKQANGSAVILLHGFGDTRVGMLGQASFLLRANYTVLLPDSRGHGSSGGDLVTYGIRERTDLRCWTDWLVRTHRVERLYGLGQSMGAGVLLQALPQEPRFRAIVAESSFSSFEEMSYDRLYDTVRLPRWAAWPMVRFGFFYAFVR